MRVAELLRLRPGDPVRLLRGAGRYPHFILGAGATGVISSNELEPDLHWGTLWVRIDEHVPGAEEWDNRVSFSIDFYGSLEAIAECLEGAITVEIKV